MGKAKAQHTAPQTYLRHFTATPHKRRPEDKEIYVFNKVSGAVRKQKIKNVCYKNYFYDYTSPDGVLVSVEDHLRTATEDVCKLALDVVCSDVTSHALALHQRGIARFAASQLIRTTATRQEHRNIADALNEIAVRAGERSECVLDSELTLEHIVHIVRRLPQLAEILAHKTWVLIKNATGIPFGTSNHPVLRHNPDDKRPYDIGVRSPGAQIYLPISAEVTLYMHDPRSDVAHVAATIGAGVVRRLNALQITESRRYVYVSDDDFALARDLMRVYPQLADVDRPHLRLEPVSLDIPT